MLVVFPSAIRFDEGAVPSFYEDHLLERVTLLENRLTQIADRLASTLDLLLRQSKFAQSDHLLLETLIDSLNALGAIEKENLTRSWRQTVTAEEAKENSGQKNKRLVEEILAAHKKPNGELFAHLVKEGIRLSDEGEEKQSLRNFEKALLLSPENAALAVSIAERLFLADNKDAAKIYLDKAHRLASRNQKVLLFSALIFADEREYEKARDCLNKLSKKPRFKTVASFIGAFVAADEADWTRAHPAFKEFAANSDLPEGHYLFGCAEFQTNRYKSAVRHLQKAVEADPNFADAWFMLALAYDKCGDEKRKAKSLALARAAKEPAAQSADYLKRAEGKFPETALPFLRPKQSKKGLLANLPMRLQKLLRREILKAINL